MKISRHTEHLIRTSEYNYVKVGATVELDSEEYEGNIGSLELISEANNLVEAAIEEDLAEARRITDPEDNHIHDWRA